MRTFIYLLLALGLATPAFTQPDPVFKYVNTPFGRLWADVGYGNITSYYDDEGELQDEDDGSLSILTGTLGGEYDVTRIGDLGVGLGAELRFANLTAEFENESESSGFKMQNLALLARLHAPTYALKTGFLFDFGPDFFDEDDETEIPASDGFNALVLGVSGTYPTDRWRVFGGLDYYLTLQESEELEGGFAKAAAVEFAVNPGDQVGLHAGGGYSFGDLELGAILYYNFSTEGSVEIDGDESDFTDGETASNLSIAPFLTYYRPGSRFQFYLRSTIRDEYLPTGFSLMGENSYAGRMSVTAGLIYGL